MKALSPLEMEPRPPSTEFTSSLSPEMTPTKSLSKKSSPATADGMATRGRPSQGVGRNSPSISGRVGRGMGRYGCRSAGVRGRGGGGFDG